MLRDPTRGGVATTIKEIAVQSEVTVTLEKAALPMKKAVKGACSLLGLDPLYVANEGKLILLVALDVVDRVLSRMRKHSREGKCDYR